jgi:hypothetical protein
MKVTGKQVIKKVQKGLGFRGYGLREERANMMHPLWWLKRVHLERDSLRVKRQYTTCDLQRVQLANLAQVDNGGKWPGM